MQAHQLGLHEFRTVAGMPHNMALGNRSHALSFGIEHKNMELGLNPMMGEWSVTIKGRPVPYSSTNKNEKERWQKEIWAALSGNRSWIYSHQVSFDVELLIDYQSIMETSEVADLDNYAKLICDSVKGLNGVVIDDCQFHRLDIAWVDAPNKDHEQVVLKFRAAPDDFLLLPITIYEMSDGLFYPFSDHNWTMDGPTAVSPAERQKRLVGADAFTRVKKQLRHFQRNSGTPQFRTFQNTAALWDHISVLIGGHAYVWGFNKTRVAESGFPIITYTEWAPPQQEAVERLTSTMVEALTTDV